MLITNDGTLDLATGRSRKETSWKNTPILWSALVEKLSVTHRTAETAIEYATAKKSRQDEIKDIGGYVGGYITGGRRKSGSVLHRELITLDIDYCKNNFWQTFMLLYDDCAAVVYSTHKHTPANPRLRLVIPLDRPVAADEYIAISRFIAGTLDIEIFDPTTFQVERLMYWPSTSKDGVYEFHSNDGNFLCADKILASYRDWRDSSQWPVSVKVDAVLQRNILKQGDPLEKPGMVGKFCRTFTVHEVLETFLKDVYTPCDVDNRFTYVHGSTSAGLVIYDNKYTYSHHGTDPTSGKLCNAFDLVRLHLFGLQDDEAKEGTPINKLPSYVAMVEWCSKNAQVRQTIGEERLSEARNDFGLEHITEDPGPLHVEPIKPLTFLPGELDDLLAYPFGVIDGGPIKRHSSEELNSHVKNEYKDIEPVESDNDNTEWVKLLDVDRKGNMYSTIDNVIIILTNDPYFKGRLAFDEFEQREVAVKRLPWRMVNKETRSLTDKDDAAIRHYLEKVYKISGLAKITDALSVHMQKNAFHPVRDYLNKVEWDGTDRVETLFIDYMGVEDSEYTRAITRKFMCAAVARVMQPGIKFDYMPVLVGLQGKMKSMLFDKLARTWFSDSMHTVEGTKAFEQLQGVWVIEMAELSSFKSSEVETVKHFISKRQDRYRVAYGHRTENFPRQCVFIGTSNNKNFLKDPTGNRRFWPLDTYLMNAIKNVSRDLVDSEIHQYWAEAVKLWRAGETLYLNDELELEAQQHQREHGEIDERAGMIEHFLEKLLPDSWDEMSIWDKRNFIKGDPLQPLGTVKRERVCVPEIWCELFDGLQKDLKPYNTKELHNIMRQLPGWKEAENKHRGRHRFSGYGLQKAYTRITDLVNK